MGRHLVAQVPGPVDPAAEGGGDHVHEHSLAEPAAIRAQGEMKEGQKEVDRSPTKIINESDTETAGESSRSSRGAIVGSIGGAQVLSP